MKKRILSIILAALIAFSLLPTAFAASDFASEVPADADATKTVYEYKFGTNKVTTGQADVTKANSYSLMYTNETVTEGKVISDPWKYAGQSPNESMTLFELNGNNGLNLQTKSSDAYAVMALYIPRPGEYKFEFTYVARSNSSTGDMYLAKCPDTFTAGKGVDFPFDNSDKIANDYDFHTGGGLTNYVALDNAVAIPEAGTYLIGFADFQKIGGWRDVSDNQ